MEDLDFLSRKQQEKLFKLFSKKGGGFMGHQLSQELEISYFKALEVLKILEQQGFCKFHDFIPLHKGCALDKVFNALPHSPLDLSLPWFCPACEKDVDNIDELRADVSVDVLEVLS